MSKQTLSAAAIGSILLFVVGCTSAVSTTDTAVKISTEAGATSIKIGGSSETYEDLKQLADAYRQQEKADGVTFDFLPPSQTSGGIQGVKNSLLDLGGLSRQLTEKDASDDLAYLKLRETPLVLIVHESVSNISNITAEEINAIYQGEITNWQDLGGPDERIVLFDLAEDENEKQVLRRAYLGDDLKITPDAIVFAEDDELIETAAITPFSMAAVPLEDELIDSPVNILSIDGVAPSADALVSGQYVMSLPLGFVFNKTPSAETQDFVAFVTSAEGQSILAESPAE
ncbi:MAG: substrate-binding domain-containing protein [Cyanobacteria bacterium P01_A01_bin.116]